MNNTIRVIFFSKAGLDLDNSNSGQQRYMYVHPCFLPNFLKTHHINFIQIDMLVSRLINLIREETQVHGFLHSWFEGFQYTHQWKSPFHWEPKFMVWPTHEIHKNWYPTNNSIFTIVRISSDHATLFFFIWILIWRVGVRTMCYTKSWRFSSAAEYYLSTASKDFQFKVVQVTPI